MKRYALFLMLSAPAFSATVPAPVPDCMSTWNENVSIEIQYNRLDRYKRAIIARPVYGACSSILHLTYDGKGLREVPPNATTVGSINLDPYHRNTLAWIRRGSNYVFPPGYTAADYIRENPIPAFSVKLNRELTQKYGHGFAGEIYREWLLNQPRNSRARSAIRKSVNEYLARGKSFTKEILKAKSQNTVLLVSMGLGWDESPDQPFYVKDFLKQIAGAGMETIVLKRDAYGRVPDNIRELVPQIRNALNSSKNVMLMGLCKGMPELLAATAEVMKDRLDKNRQQIPSPSHGKITGIIGISPMMSGLYWADFEKQIVVADLLESLLEKLPGKAHMAAQYLNAVDTMSSPDINALYAESLPHLPADVTYLNFIGVIPDNGILKNDTTAMMPFIRGNEMLNIAKGANDGFIEYPKSQIRNEFGRKVFNVPLEGSHMITDGKFDELDFRQKINLEALYYGILNFALDQR